MLSCKSWNKLKPCVQTNLKHTEAIYIWNGFYLKRIETSIACWTVEFRDP